jgi:hypothetical protein
MKKIILISLGIIVILLIIIQFVPGQFPATSFDNKDDLLLHINTDKEVAEILRTSCYDCHSNETNYPWYSYVAPVKWLVIRDINNGRQELNFSDWNTLDKREQVRLLGNISDEVTDEFMPLPIYTVIHRDARLSGEEKEIISRWTESMTEQIFGE